MFYFRNFRVTLAPLKYDTLARHNDTKVWSRSDPFSHLSTQLNKYCALR